MNGKEQPVKWKVWLLRGFLVFAIVLALLGLVLLHLGRGSILAARRAGTALQISSIETACLNYKTEYYELPDTSDNARLIKIPFLLVKATDFNSNGEEVDPWGTPLRITFDADTKVRVVSAGQDKIFGTADDITNQ
jgi:hypothetical protein